MRPVVSAGLLGVRALRELAPAYEEPAERSVRPTGTKPAVKPTSTDPRVLLGMAKQSLEDGNLDKAEGRVQSEVGKAKDAVRDTLKK